MNVVDFFTTIFTESSQLVLEASKILNDGLHQLQRPQEILAFFSLLLLAGLFALSGKSLHFPIRQKKQYKNLEFINDFLEFGFKNRERLEVEHAFEIYLGKQISFEAIKKIMGLENPLTAFRLFIKGQSYIRFNVDTKQFEITIRPLKIWLWKTFWVFSYICACAVGTLLIFETYSPIIIVAGITLILFSTFFLADAIAINNTKLFLLEAEKTNQSVFDIANYKMAILSGSTPLNSTNMFMLKAGHISYATLESAFLKAPLPSSTLTPATNPVPAVEQNESANHSSSVSKENNPAEDFTNQQTIVEASTDINPPRLTAEAAIVESAQVERAAIQIPVAKHVMAHKATFSSPMMESLFTPVTEDIAESTTPESQPSVAEAPPVRPPQITPVRRVMFS
ncbi:hypothetical protein HZU77_004675 [Neisseriaceae bacterium TC5R-5]|nr:hypothetical protein [Neisseriaceae bacterium TC5R-5]